MRQPLFYAVLAQLAEQPAFTRSAAGSNPANGTIAAGSAYPAQNRRRKENRVTKPWFHTQKGVSIGTTKTAATETSSYKLVPGSQAGTEPQGRAFQCSTNEKSHPPASLRKGGFFKRESRHLPIFAGRLQPTIFGTTEFNFCVRNGNRWNLCVIGTGQICFKPGLHIFSFT